VFGSRKEGLESTIHPRKVVTDYQDRLYPPLDEIIENLQPIHPTFTPKEGIVTIDIFPSLQINTQTL